MAVLKLNGIKRSFTQGYKSLDVLKGVSLTIKKGELVGLVGSSGSGKSTLLQVAGLLDSSYQGELSIKGRSVAGLSDDEKSRIRRDELGFIYQAHHLLPDFTALENVSIVLRISGAKPKEAVEKAKEVLTRLGLGERLDHTPAKLSGGEQQRVAIARAMVGGPSVLLADEPTGNLDEDTAAKVLDLFLETMREFGLAAIIATHDKSLAARLDRQFLLTEGVLTEIK